MNTVDHKTFFDTFSPLLLSLILTGTFGLLTGIYLERLRNKSLILSYTTTFQSLGTAIKDKFWGNISISHNEREIKHLSLVTLVIKNSTRADSQHPLNLEVWLDDRSQFLGHSGHYDTGNSIQLEDVFGEQYGQLVQDIDEDFQLHHENQDYVTPIELNRRRNFFQNNRKLNLPVFNRKSSVNINFLTENFDGVTPKIYMSILQKGTKLIPEGDKVKAEQIKKIASGLTTAVIYILGLVWVFSNYHGKEDAIISTIIIGTCSYLLGYGLYYLFMYLRRFFW